MASVVFCNSSVIFLLDNTTADGWLFAPCNPIMLMRSAGEHGHGVEQPDLSTAYFFDGAMIHMRSSAVLRAISLGNTPARFLAFGLVIPKLIRDYCYSVISHFRKHMPRLGLNDCRLLAANQRARFLCE
jgi:predicted DCC family thiol-disulfide oxidoreductase YuxK